MALLETHALNSEVPIEWRDRVGENMDWWLIEYDNKNSDAHTFAIKVQNELRELLVAAGGGPFGAAVYSNSVLSEDNKLRFYFNWKSVMVPGVRELLAKYDAKECTEPLEQYVIRARAVGKA
jgi:hypothetical protein